MDAPPAVAKPATDLLTPEPAPVGRFEVYEAIRPRGQWRWRFVLPDGRAAIVSAAAFIGPDAEQHAADDAAAVRDAAAGAPITVTAGPAGGLGR